MSAAKHTPGPWRLGKRSDDVVADVNAGHRDDEDSLDFYGGHLVAESIARRADRALIAAAPELLASLRDMLQYVTFDDEGPLDRNEFNAMFERAQAAAAKAEGGAS